LTNIADFLSTQILSVSSAAATTVGKTLTDYKKKVDEENRMKEIEIKHKREAKQKRIQKQLEIERQR
jgi:23S rRNA pseudoU1915 N3-methylase RlmH